jgi:DnaJ-class molecular chaperone
MIAWLVIAGVAAAPVYWVVCWFWPYTSCRRCGGGGRKRSPSGKNWRPCRKCKGSGMRLRTGRRVSNFLAGHRDSAR